jgi:HSP20 family protein
MAENQLMANKEATEVAGPEAMRGGMYFAPRCDIYETADEVVVQADLPGVRPENLDIRFADNELTLCGKVEPRQAAGTFTVQEYGVGDYYRSFTISRDVDAAKITAEYKDGVLTVHLPKPAKAKPRRITVKTE